MYELLRKQFTSHMSVEEKVNITREYLQILTLKIIFDRGMFRNMAFVGGTALRLLYGSRRFSEDLDFSLIRKKGYNFERMLSQILSDLKHYGLKVEARPKKDRIVHSALLRFKELLPALGLSSIAEQKLSIRLEVDTNPPKGWRTELSPVTKSYIFAVNHFDLPSLYATKLHACFFRRYTKGRDFYDLVWYLGKGARPNYKLLNNAIKQTEKKDLKLNQTNFKSFLRDKLSKVNYKKIREDVERFLEDKNELKMLNKKTILQSVK